VFIRGKSALSMALLLHEIATNAAKYGALSFPSGHIDVSWSVQQDELLLTWRERGGPTVNGQPENEGFGSFLSRMTVTGQLGGKISYDWKPEGLTMYLSAPLDRLVK
jgi:two-component system, chemotaxis family, CheB/CheR fusion protein